MKGAVIKKIMIDMGINQTDLAKKLGMPVRNLSNTLATDDVRSSFVEGVATALNIPISALYGESSSPSARAGDGGMAIAGSGNNLNVQVDKFLDLLKEKDVQLARSQGEIDKLLEMLNEKLR